MIQNRFRAIRYGSDGGDKIRREVDVVSIENGSLMREMISDGIGSCESENSSSSSSNSNSVLTMDEKELVRDLFNSGKFTSLPPHLLAKCIRAKYGQYISAHDDDGGANDNESKNGRNVLHLYYRGPSSVDMALHLIQEEGIVPDLVIVLDAPDDVLIERICDRRIDPLTRKTYHLKHDPPPTYDVRLMRRLVQRLGDDRDTFNQRLQKHRTQTEPLLKFYESNLGKERIRVIDATLDREQVFHQICTAIAHVFGAKSFVANKTSKHKRRNSG